MTVAADPLYQYARCACGQRKLKTDVSCGMCPCRRATDDECEVFQSTGVEPLRCCACDYPIVPSVRPGYEPRGTHVQTPRCYECFKLRSVKATCMCPKHRGDKLFPAEQAGEYCILSTNKTTQGQPNKVTVCPTCAIRYQLTPWDDYALSRGTIDRTTGEVSPLLQHTPELKLSRHPIEAFGGMKVCWCPKRGIEGTYVKAEGFTRDNVAVFNPLRFASFQYGSKRHRIILCTRMDYPTSASTYQGTVWHPSVSRWFDVAHEASGDHGMRQFGWMYVRVTGVKSTDAHTFAISSFNQWRRDNEGNTVAQWLSHCETLETNH